MKEHTQTFTQLTAAFTMPQEIASRFELLLGVHPEEQRHLSEEEEERPLALLRYVRRQDLLSIQHPQGIEKLALLWLEFFPEIDDYLHTPDFYESLTKKVFEEVEILNLAYAFYPVAFSGKEGEQNLTRYKEIREAAEQIQRTIEENVDVNPRARGKVTWTLPFPANGLLGRIAEHKAGLSTILKQRLGLNNYKPGLLCNFLLHHHIPMARLLDPHQFEDLTGMIFQEEGWNVTRMRQTRDGGKDIIAKQVIEGAPTIAYIQAKRYSTKKVGIREVKEFVATVAGDKVDKGIIVTTSYFSKPATQWLQERGVSLATVELVDRTLLESRILEIADAETAAYNLR